MIVCQFQLADVNEGDGGLCVIPGSHKANFPLPQKICHWQEHREIVYNVPCQTGDMVIFNEATLHGTLPWVAEHERALPTLPLLAQISALCRWHLPDQPARMGRRTDRGATGRASNHPISTIGR